MIKRKMLAIVLAIAMVFTFSFGAVGAYAEDTHKVPGDHDYVITAINWNADYTKATYDVKCKTCGEVDEIDAQIKPEYGENKFNIIYTSTPQNKEHYPVVDGVDISPVKVLNLNGAEINFNDNPKIINNKISGNIICASGFSFNGLEKKITVIDVNNPTNKITSNHYHQYTDWINTIPFEYEPYADGVYQVSTVGVEKPDGIKVIGSTTTDITVKTGHIERSLVKFNVSGLEQYATTFTYDGKAHTVSITNPRLNVKYAIPDKTGKLEYTTEAPVIKEVGTYHIYFRATLDGTSNYEKFDTVYTITPAKATIKPIKTTVYKVYDCEPFSLTDDMFAVTGVAEGETLINGISKTGADVAVYNISPVIDPVVAKNYTITGNDSTISGVIEKADNFVSITKSKYTIKKGKKATIKTKTNFGEPSFKKLSGNSKISVSDSGVIKVKKSAKKGTYKVKVKALVEKTDNYSADSVVRKLTVVVK